MSKRFLSIFVSIMLVTVLFAGCGKSDEGEAAAENSAEAAQEELPSGDVSLRVWGAEEDEELVGKIIDSFIAEYGSMANFTITFEAHSESECKDDLLEDVLNAPEVFTFADDQLMALVASGMMKPVENADEISSRNLEAADSAASINGTLYAYPLTADNGYFLFYNGALLSEDDVQTMDSLLKAANAHGKKVFMEMTNGWYMYSFFGLSGLQIGLNDDGISTYCNWNSKSGPIKGVDVAEGMCRLGLNPAFAAKSANGFPAGCKDGTFIAGVSGMWDESAIKEAWGNDYEACKLPTYTVGGQQLQMASYAGYKLVGVNSYSPNKAWAAKFADWMTNENNQTLRFEMRGQGPSNINAASSGAVAESKGLKALQQQSEFSSLQRVGSTYWVPADEFGTHMSQGNPEGKDYQILLNVLVSAITGEDSTGDEDVAEEEATEGEEESEATEETEEVTEEEPSTEQDTEDNKEEENTEENAADESSDETSDESTDKE